MWTKIAGIILRNRIAFIAGVLLGTIFMGFQARKIQMSYEVQICSPKQTVPISTIPVSEKLSGKRGMLWFLPFRIPVSIN